MALSSIEQPWERVNVRSNIKELCAEYFDWALMDFHVELLEAMFDGGYLAINLPSDHAKDLDRATPILTAKGWKLMADVAIGDQVYGSDGKPTLVIGVREFAGQPCYKVSFANGAEMVAGAEHQWMVWDWRRQRTRIVTTREIHDTPNPGRCGFQIRCMPVLQLPDRQLPVDPYVLGAWLGDGDSAGARINSGLPDIEWMRDQFSAAGYTATNQSVAQKFGVLGLRIQLRQLGVLKNKHIPEQYLLASAAQRTALLYGLMDTDGTVSVAAGGQCSFTNTNHNLADGVLFLARSLGWKAAIGEYRAKLNGRDCGPVWKVSWHAWKENPPFRMPRKIAKLNSQHKFARRSAAKSLGIDSAIPVPTRPTKCIQVAAPDGMFLAGKALVATHNSTMGTFLYPLLSLIDNPNESHIICGANINDSKRRVKMLELELETNQALTKDFPWIAKPEDKESRVWTNIQFNVVGRTVNKPNPSVLAAAIGSADIKGRRAKLIMDDIEGLEARYSPLKREQTYEWVKTEAWRCYEDKRESLRPLLCLLGTPFDISSLYFRVEQEGWQVIRYPVYRDNSHLVQVNSMGEPIAGTGITPNYLWPDKADKVERARKRMKKWQFSIMYLMDPTGGDQTQMSAQEITESTQEAQFDADQFTGFVSLDPASGAESRRADYAGITVLRLNWPYGEELPTVEVQEAHAFTQGLFEQVHFCADLASRYQYPVIYETNSQQGGTYQSTFQHLHPEVELLRHYTTRENKLDTSMGLSVIKTLVTQRKLHVPESELESDGIQSLIQELRDLKPPFTKHDHICASLWFAVRYAYERARHQKLAPIQSTYLQPYRNPLNAGFQVGFQSNTPSARERLAAQEIQREVDRFRDQLNGRRSSGKPE